VAFRIGIRPILARFAGGQAFRHTPARLGPPRETIIVLSDYRRALVTGASSGFGAAVTRSLRARGIETIALARRADRLDALAAETGCETLAVDLRDTDALYAALSGLDIDILVNNAGVNRAMGKTLLETSREDIDDTTLTNVLSVLHVIRAVAPGMVARRRGHIVNIGSIAGLHPITQSLYGASKGAIHTLSMDLRLDLAGTRVRVTEICPGRARTELFDAGFEDAEDARKFAAGFDLLEAEDIAEAVLYALDTPLRVNVSTIELFPTEQAAGGPVVTPVGDG